MSHDEQLEAVDSALRRCRAHVAVIVERGGPYDLERAARLLTEFEHALLNELAKVTTYDVHGRQEL